MHHNNTSNGRAERATSLCDGNARTYAWIRERVAEEAVLL
jgi:hypothetical protein